MTAEALAPFRSAQAPRPEGDPQPLPYLYDEVLLLTERMRDVGLPAHRLTLSNSRSMYFTVAQMVTHHSVNGCQLQPGDLFGSGTLSPPRSTLFPYTTLFRSEGAASIGFGECRGRIVAAN